MPATLPLDPPRPASLLFGRFRPALLVFGLALALAQITRLALLAVRPGVLAHGIGELAAALAAGLVLDLAVCLWLALPWILYLAFAPSRWLATRVQRALMLLFLAAWIFGQLFVAAAEGFFFDEFESRFNFVAVDYLFYPTEVVGNIWESYPTGRILAGLAVGSLLAAWALRRHLAPALEQPARLRSRAGFAGSVLALAALASWALPTGWTQVSPDRLLDEVAGNGYASFVRAALGADTPYDGFFLTRPTESVLARLPRLLAEPGSPAESFEPGSSLRPIAPPTPERPLNVVVVLEESLGAEFVGTLGAKRANLTPEIDALAAEGTLLTRAYATGNRTIRAIEATTAGLPPLAGESVVRRPTSRGLFTLPGVLAERGYETVFFYGGDPIFDGMGRYARENGIQRIVSRTDFPADTFSTTWGVCDEALFARTLEELDRLDAAGKPFYALALTVSNHRPYKYPTEHVPWTPGLSRRENLVRYADHALGEFVRNAKSHRFFDHTVFVLMGDHGARVYGAGEIPLPSYRVPILFYGPGIVAAGVRIDTTVSSLDVPPTVLGLLGHPYRSRFFGRDIFHDGDMVGRALLSHNHTVALLREGRMALLGLQKRSALYEVPRDEGPFVELREPDEASRELLEDAIAYFQGADVLYRTGRYQMAPVQEDHRLAAHATAAQGN